MRWFFKSIFFVQVLVIAAIIAGVIYLAPAIGVALEGAVDRFDFMIGYEQGD